MTKQEFVDKVADKAGLSRRDAGKAVDAVLETTSDTLKGGGDVSCTRGGKFSTSERAASFFTSRLPSSVSKSSSIERLPRLAE